MGLPYLPKLEWFRGANVNIYIYDYTVDMHGMECLGIVNCLGKRLNGFGKCSKRPKGGTPRCPV